MGCRDDGYQGAYSEVRARRYLYQMRPYTEEPGAGQFACPVLDWRRRERPLRRPYGKLRPLGIPVMIDRCVQSMVKNALEPSWEARFEGCSYGFRPGRGCHDAIEKIFKIASPKNRKKWVLDADIKGAFDNISHEYLLTTIGRVPGYELIKQWVKAGYVDKGVFHETEAGTPQGG